MIQQGQFEVFESEEAAGRGNDNFEKGTHDLHHTIKVN